MQNRYKTRQREALFCFLRENAHRCFSAKELRLALSKGGVELGEATIYRTLDLLVADGALKRFDQGASKSATYQYLPDNPACAHHLHFKCTDCGKLYHLECSQLQGLTTHLKDHHGFRVNQADTVLYGSCEACSK